VAPLPPAERALLFDLLRCGPTQATTVQATHLPATVSEEREREGDSEQRVIGKEGLRGAPEAGAYLCFFWQHGMACHHVFLPTTETAATDRFTRMLDTLITISVL
jgi:hypothetical protein